MVLEFAISLLLAAQGEQAPVESCAAIVDRLEVRRAVRAGQVATIIEAAELVEGCSGREELLVLAAQTAWEQMDFQATDLLASSALRLIGDRNCAWTPLAARLAFVTGFSRRVSQERGASFYFYVAGRVNERAGGLDRNWRFVVSEFAESFGTYPPDDIFAFGSPYIDRPYRVDEEQCADLPAFFIHFDGQVDDLAFVVMDLRTDEDGIINRARQILSYPGPVPSHVERQLRNRDTIYSYRDEYFLLQFRPCLLDTMFEDEGDPVCIGEVPPDGETYVLGPKQ